MNVLILWAAMMVGQLNTMQSRTVVYLTPHRDLITIDFGGKLLNLINAPSTIYLPVNPPKLDSQGEPWSIDIKNLGPTTVTVVGKPYFSIAVSIGETIHVAWNGARYATK